MEKMIGARVDPWKIPQLAEVRMKEELFPLISIET